MKQFVTALAAIVLLQACKHEKSANQTNKPNVTYPYKAEYTSDFSMGDPNHSKMVLDLYKLWEEGKVDEMRGLLADSVFIDFPDGNKFQDNTADSLIRFAKLHRKDVASVRTQFDGWMPVRANDKKEDYVLTWNNDYTTDAAGKLDSVRIHAYFLIKNNKIRGWSEFMQKLAPPVGEMK